MPKGIFNRSKFKINIPPADKDLRTKAAKLWLGQQAGLTSAEAARRAGIAPFNVPEMQKTQVYQRVAKKYGEILQDKMSLDNLADEHLKVVKQNNDLSPKLAAIKMAKEYIEPETEIPQNQNVVNVVIEKLEVNPVKQIPGK